MPTTHNAVANRKAIEAYKETYEMIVPQRAREFNKAAITQNMLVMDKETRAELSGAPLKAFIYVQLGYDVDTIMTKLGHDRNAGKPTNQVDQNRLGISPNGKVFDADSAFEAGLIDERERDLAKKKYIKRMKAQAKTEKDEDNEPIKAKVMPLKKRTVKKVKKAQQKVVETDKAVGFGVKKRPPTKEAIKILKKKFNNEK
jgi:hypothetical protein